jgi:hypothetical protein
MRSQIFGCTQRDYAMYEKTGTNPIMICMRSAEADILLRESF